MKYIFTFSLFFFFFLCPMRTNAQNFKMGFDIAAHQVRIKSGTGILGGYGSPLSIHFNVEYFLLSDLSFGTGLGRTFHTQFLGWEFGLYSKYRYYYPLYFSGGILLHMNEGEGIANGEWTNYATIFMIYPGLGVNVSPMFSIELNYFVPLSEKIIGGSINYSSDPPETTTVIFERMIRLNLMFEWDL